MFSSASHRGALSRSSAGIFNMLKNPGLTGAVAGTPGTYSTSWGDAVGVLGTLASPAVGLTFSATVGNRQFMGQQVTLAPNTLYFASVNVLAVTGASGTDAILQIAVVSGGATFPTGQAAVTAVSATLGRNRVLVLAGVAGAVVTFRIGVGCGTPLASAAASVTLSAPVLTWRL